MGTRLNPPSPPPPSTLHRSSSFSAASSSSSSSRHHRSSYPPVYGLGPYEFNKQPNMARPSTEPRRSSVSAQEEGVVPVQIGHTPDNSKSPLRRLAEKGNAIQRMLSKTRMKPNKLPSFDESFDVSAYAQMVSDFEPVKRRREDPFLPSPSRKMSRTSPPTSSPRAYKHLPLKRSCPPEIMTQSTTSAKDIPLPPSPVTRSTIASSSALPEGDEESIKPERRSISPIGPFDTTQTSYSAPAVPKALPATPTDTAHPSYTAKAAPDRSDAFSGFDRLFADFSSSTLDHPRRPWSSGDGDRLIPRQAQRSGTSAGVGPGVGAITPSLTSGPSSVYSSRAFTPDQSRLETAINSLHNVIVSLQATNSDQATYILRQADLETRLHSMDRELGAVREENLRLEVAVRREREGRKRIERHASRAEEAWAAKLQVAEDAKSNAQSSLHHLHLSQSTSASRIQHLESQIREYSNENHSLRNHVSELEMEVSRLAGAFDIVRSDHARRENDLKRRLEEAEFMHIALKESGEKMGRELEVAKRRVGELEMRAKGGFI